VTRFLYLYPSGILRFNTEYYVHASNVEMRSSVAEIHSSASKADAARQAMHERGQAQIAKIVPAMGTGNAGIEAMRKKKRLTR